MQKRKPRTGWALLGHIDKRPVLAIRAPPAEDEDEDIEGRTGKNEERRPQHLATHRDQQHATAQSKRSLYVAGNNAQAITGHAWVG